VAVARLEQSESRDFLAAAPTPDFASLNPGYNQRFRRPRCATRLIAARLERS
jgi:hypothetical protein